MIYFINLLHLIIIMHHKIIVFLLYIWLNLKITFQKARCAVLSVRRQLLTTKLSCFFNSQSAYESRNVGLGFFEGSSCDTTPMPRLCGQQIKGGHSGWGGRDPCDLSWTLRRPFLCYLGTRCLAAADSWCIDRSPRIPRAQNKSGFEGIGDACMSKRSAPLYMFVVCMALI